MTTMPDPLASMERDVEVVGAVLEVTYTTDAGHTGSPPPDMVRAQFLTEGYSTVSVRISRTGVYTVVVT